MSKKRVRKGVILYFEWIDALEPLSNERRGRLLFAALKYAKSGEVPADFKDDETLTALWSMIVARIDADGIHFKETSAENSLKGKYGIYKAQMELAERKYLKFADWRELYLAGELDTVQNHTGGNRDKPIYPKEPDLSNPYAKYRED